MKPETDHFTVFGFDSTHDAVRAETVMLDAGIDVVLIPTPAALGTLCGFAARVPADQKSDALLSLARAGIDAYGAIEFEDRSL